MPIYQWFSEVLIKWNDNYNHRFIHFKGIKDPYKIWISEVIMQQTKVEQGEKYYLKITDKYPTVKHLAEAKEQELYSMWQGLGYYNRCRNMHSTAKFIQEKYDGVFPKDYASIRALKGVGDYTAAAIASFAYDLPHAVVDGNVVRVLSRIFGLTQSFHSSSGKKFFQELAQSLLYLQSPSTYNQAMMDFGATICKPKSPECQACPFQKRCVAYKSNAIEDFPVKKVKKPLRVRYFHFLVDVNKDSIAIVKRSGKDIWHNLYILPYLETDSEFFPQELLKANAKHPHAMERQVQILSHQRIIGLFYSIPLSAFSPKNRPSEAIHIPISSIPNHGFPKLIVAFLKNNHYL